MLLKLNPLINHHTAIQLMGILQRMGMLNLFLNLLNHDTLLLPIVF